MYVDLDLLKKHVRSDDFADDDDYLQHLLDVAEESVITATNRSADELLEMGGGAFPAPLKHAVLLQAAHLYNQRESVGTSQAYPVPYALEALVKPFRKLVDDDEDDEDEEETTEEAGEEETTEETEGGES